MKTKPLWPLTYVRAARWLDCEPRTVSRLAQGRKVTFGEFRWMLSNGIGNSSRLWSWSMDWVRRRRGDVHVEIDRFGRVTVAGKFLPAILADFRAGASREDLALRYRITVPEVEAAIAFPW
ncbi:MAG: hypothetical protein RIS45_543 [Planctomycetota bacterium]|jgi:hypothetical protein